MVATFRGSLLSGLATFGIFDKNVNIFSLIFGGSLLSGSRYFWGSILIYLFLLGGGGRRYFWVSLLWLVATYLGGCYLFGGSLLLGVATYFGGSLLLGVATYFGGSLLLGGRYFCGPLLIWGWGVATFVGR